MIIRSAVFDSISGSNAPANEPGVPSSGAEDNRCIYHFPSGRRCRQTVSPGDPQFCLTHASKAAPLPSHDEALAAELVEAAGELATPEDVRRVMLKVFRGMAQRRISGKDAGVICYIAQTILHCQRDTAYQRKLELEAKRNRPTVYINDLPCPKSERAIG